MAEENRVKLDTVISRNPEIIHSAIDNEVVMMSVDQGLFFGIDKIGTHIWNLMEIPVTAEALIEVLVKEYDVSHDQCTLDTLRFLNNMLAKKVILIEEKD